MSKCERKYKVGRKYKVFNSINFNFDSSEKTSTKPACNCFDFQDTSKELMLGGIDSFVIIKKNSSRHFKIP